MSTEVTIDPGGPEAAAAVAAARRLLTARFAASAEAGEADAPTPSAHWLWDSLASEVAQEVLAGDAETMLRRLAYLLWALTDAAYDLTETALVLVHGRGSDLDALRRDPAAALLEVVSLAFAPTPPQ